LCEPGRLAARIDLDLLKARLVALYLERARAVGAPFVMMFFDEERYEAYDGPALLLRDGETAEFDVVRILDSLGDTDEALAYLALRGWLPALVKDAAIDRPLPLATNQHVTEP
jgi:hypothetical protein